VSLPPHKRVRWMALSAIPVLFCTIALLQREIDAQGQAASEADQELLLRSPEAVKKLSLGYDALMGDIYWTRAVQYYGANAGKRDADFHLLWPLLDVATTLDPKLEVAYHFGAIFLSEPGNVGAGRTDLAVRLVQKGIAANPDNWQLGTDLGFLYYWRMKDYPDAAAVYLKTSQIPNSPPWIKMMAARVEQTGGSLETSSMIWSEIYESTNDPSVKKQAAHELQGIRARMDMQQLDTIAESYQARFGRYPSSEQELLSAGLLVGIPADPNGFAYEFGADGKSHLNAKTTFEMPLEPKVFSAPSR
jgi:hypothetical protein